MNSVEQRLASMESELQKLRQQRRNARHLAALLGMCLLLVVSVGATRPDDITDRVEALEAHFTEDGHLSVKSADIGSLTSESIRLSAGDAKVLLDGKRIDFHRDGYMSRLSAEQVRVGFGGGAGSSAALQVVINSRLSPGLILRAGDEHGQRHFMVYQVKEALRKKIP